MYVKPIVASTHNSSRVSRHCLGTEPRVYLHKVYDLGPRSEPNRIYDYPQPLRREVDPEN